MLKRLERHKITLVRCRRFKRVKYVYIVLCIYDIERIVEYVIYRRVAAE